MAVIPRAIATPQSLTQDIPEPSTYLPNAPQDFVGPAVQGLGRALMGASNSFAQIGEKQAAEQRQKDSYRTTVETVKFNSAFDDFVDEQAKALPTDHPADGFADTVTKEYMKRADAQFAGTPEHLRGPLSAKLATDLERVRNRAQTYEKNQVDTYHATEVTSVLDELKKKIDKEPDETVRADLRNQGLETVKNAPLNPEWRQKQLKAWETEGNVLGVGAAVKTNGKILRDTFAPEVQGGLDQAKPGFVAPTAARTMIMDQVKQQGLVGVVPKDGAEYGIKTGSAAEWTKFFLGLGYHESELANFSTGDGGKSKGIFQLSNSDAPNYGLNGGQPFTDEQLKDPAQNTAAAVAIAKSLLSKDGSIRGGLGQYWGPIKGEGWTPGNGRDKALPLDQLASGSDGERDLGSNGAPPTLHQADNPTSDVHATVVTVRPGTKMQGVRDDLVDIINKASADSPYEVRIISGQRDGDRNNHGHGSAIDIALYDKATGKMLPNYQSGEAFKAYQDFANRARAIQLRDHPEIGDQFRWGGYFSGPKGKYGAMDLMHFDVDGRGLGMGGGSWDKGLTEEQKRLFAVADNSGMGAAGLGGGRGGGGQRIQDLPEFKALDFETQQRVLGQYKSVFAQQEKLADDMAKQELQTQKLDQQRLHDHIALGIQSGDVKVPDQVWEKIQSGEITEAQGTNLLKALDEKNKGDNLGYQYLQAQGPQNAYDDNAKKGAESAFQLGVKQAAAQFPDDPQQRSDAIQRAAEMLIDSKKIVPKSWAASIRGGLDSPDIKVVQGALDRADRVMHMTEDRGFNGVEGGDAIEKAAMFYRLRRDAAGYGSADPAEKAQAQIKAAQDYQETQTPEFKRNEHVRSEEVKKITDKIKFSDIAPDFKAHFYSSAANGGTGRMQDAVVADYKDLYRDNYMITGSDSTARQMTDMQIQKLYGVSNVTGQKLLMRNPPETVYGPTYDKNGQPSTEWITRQLVDDTTKALGHPVKAEDIYLKPNGREAKDADGVYPETYELWVKDATGTPERVPNFSWHPKIKLANDMATAEREAAFKGRRDPVPVARAQFTSDSVPKTVGSGAGRRQLTPEELQADADKRNVQFNAQAKKGMDDIQQKREAERLRQEKQATEIDKTPSPFVPARRNQVPKPQGGNPFGGGPL
jgi:hypothetical protein